MWDESELSSTSGGHLALEGDPNPPTTGFPIADGMSYFYYPVDYYFVPVADTTAGPGTWDFSYGVIAVVPEPTSLALAGLGAAALMIVRRRR
jgi:hypothetical protein